MIKAEIFARTETVQNLSSDEIAGVLAGICQMSDDFETLVRQDKATALKRAGFVKTSGHHSCYCHEYVTIILEGVPKIIAMMLNSLKFYNTSEKSGRYTVMDKCSPKEKEIYDKWQKKLTEITKQTYPFLSDAVADKKGKENARKMLSVFTPTVMAYSTSIQQWNYILDWCENYRQDFKYYITDTPFYSQVAKYLEELADAIKPLVYIEGLRDNKSRKFGFIKPTMKPGKEYFGSVYNAVYKASFDEVAQCERHRVLDVVIHFRGYAVTLEREDFSIPAIIKDDEVLRGEWYRDILSLKSLFPTGMLVLVEERGTFEGWRKSKCLERDCGHAQLEIMQRNAVLHKKFEANRGNLSEEEQKMLDEVKACVRCKYPDFKCTSPCPWGPEIAKNRLI